MLNQCKCNPFINFINRTNKRPLITHEPLPRHLYIDPARCRHGEIKIAWGQQTGQPCRGFIFMNIAGVRAGTNQSVYASRAKLCQMAGC